MSKHHVGSDFAGFDANRLDQFFCLTTTTEPKESVFVFSHTFFDARKIALLYFRDEKGLTLSYNQVRGEALNEGAITIPIGNVFLCKDETGTLVEFETTRATDREGARRGAGLRKRQSVARKGGREERPIPYRMQENGQGIVSTNPGVAPEASPGRSPGGEIPSDAVRTGSGALGDSSVGHSNGAARPVGWSL